MIKAKPFSAPWLYIAAAMGLGMLFSPYPAFLIALLLFFSLLSIFLRNPDFLILALFSTIGFLRGLPYDKTRKLLGELDNTKISSDFRIYNEAILKLDGTQIELRTTMPGFKQGTLLKLKGTYKKDLNMLIPNWVETVKESRNLFDNIHNCLNLQLLQTFGLYEEGILIKALLTGDRKGLSRETVEKFRKAGIAHLLAISGLHIGFLFILFNTTFMFIFRMDVISKLLASVLVGLYTFSLGPLAPCLRAFWFLFFLNLSYIFGRKVRALNIWGITFSLSIFFKPPWLRDPSFLMSYFAIFGYLFLSEIFPIKVEREKWMGKIEGYFISVLVPLLFTLPFQFIFFKRVSLVSFISNVLFIPVTFLLIFESFFTLLFHIIQLPIWTPFRNCALFLSRFMLDTSEYLSRLPGGSFNSGSAASFLVFSLLYVILIAYIRIKLKAKGD
uniref:ComEC/Rec2 family competence protein n=1 Tax=candidate division WOR-3 bacterium TaxID=2052148 RepID=A0A7V3ZWG4_UNCW3